MQGYENICGIDFGTTNSAVSVKKKGGAFELVPLQNGKTFIPTAVFYGKKDVTFGDEAVQNYLDGEEGRLMRSLKKVLSSDLITSSTQINGFPHAFRSILTQFLIYLKQRTEDFTHTTIDKVVMGRPVHFVDDNERADHQAQEELKSIALQAGFTKVLFQFEPIAAAQAQERLLKKETLVFVVDVGGGTSDFTVMKCRPITEAKQNRAEDILGTSGVYIGGNNFDEKLALKSFMPEFGLWERFGSKGLPLPVTPFSYLSKWSSVNDLYLHKTGQEMKKVYQEIDQPDLKKKYKNLMDIAETQQGHSFLNLVEKTKVDLTTKDVVDVTVNFLKTPLVLKIQRSDFENTLAGDIDKLKAAIEECLKQAAIRAQEIELVLLTGGSTEIPLIQNLIKDMFPNTPVNQSEKLTSVAMGLGHDALRRFGNKENCQI